MSRFDLFVIGAGSAGLTAADEAAGRGLSVCLAEEQMFGGLITNVNHLWPGIEGLPASGADLAAEMMERVAERGVTIVFEPVTALDVEGDGTLRVTTSENTHSARCVAIASGARLRKLEVPGVAEFEHRGVSFCADCDGPLYRGQDVVVVGGGDSALQEALVLAGLCSTVHLVHRRGEFSARKDLTDRLADAPAIRLHLGSVVEALDGTDALSGVRVRDLASGEVGVVPCSGFFPFVGLEPNTGFLPAGIERDDGLVRVSDRMESSVPNVFAIGAARAGYSGLIADAARDAKSAVAAICDRIGRA